MLSVESAYDLSVSPTCKLTKLKGSCNQSRKESFLQVMPGFIEQFSTGKCIELHLFIVFELSLSRICGLQC